MRPRRQAFGYDAEYPIDSMGLLGALIDLPDELGRTGLGAEPANPARLPSR